MPQTKTCKNFKIFATGESFRSLEYQFRISRKFVSYINDEVCKAIVTVLAETYLKFPSRQKNWKNIQKKFDEIIGCDMGSQYYNYKGTKSVVPLVVARSNYKVTLADVRMNGRILDVGVLKRSKLGQMPGEDTLNLPAPEPLPGNSVPTPYVFIGDDALALQPNLMKPFQRKIWICLLQFATAVSHVQDEFHKTSLAL